TADEVRTGDQSESCQADRPYDSAERAGAGGQDHKMTANSEQKAVGSRREARPTIKRIVVCLLATVFLLTLSQSNAQQPKKVPRIGFLAGSDDPNTPGPQVEAFRRGLQELGYVEVKNILVEYRYVEGNVDRIP